MDQTLQRLQQIAEQGQANDQFIVQPPIVEGHRLRNEVMRGMIEKFKDNPEVSKEELLEIILKIDARIESGEVTNEILTEIDNIINKS